MGTSLQELLRTLFTEPGALRRWLAANGHDLKDDVAWDREHRAVTEQVADKLLARGVVDATLLARLEAEFPKQAALIQAFAAQLGPALTWKDRPELFIKLGVEAGVLVREVWVPYRERVGHYRGPDSADPFSALLGGEWKHLLTRAAGRAVHVPDRLPFRVRLHAPPPLAGRPWNELAWDRKRLVDHGWSVELVDAALPERDCALDAPGPILVVSPNGSTFARVVEDVAHRAWTRAPSMRVARSVAEATRAPGPTPLLLAVDGACPAELLRATTPRIVSVVRGELPATLPPGVSALGAHPDEAAAARFLRRVLVDGTEPGLAAAQAGGLARTAYDGWRMRTWPTVKKRDRARLRLDRTDPRARAHKALADLMASEARRVVALVAVGDETDHVEQFLGQLEDYLKDPGRTVALWSAAGGLGLPDGAFERLQVDDHLRFQLGQQPGETLKATLGRYRREPVDTLRTLVVLDFGPPGAAHPPPPRDQLVAWLLHASETLAAACPDDLRVLAWLPVLAPRDEHADLHRLVESLRRDRRLQTPRFRAEALPALAEVAYTDLVDFLDDPDNSSCPPGLVHHAAARLFGEAAGGPDAETAPFSKVVALIEAAEDGSWEARYGEAT